MVTDVFWGREKIGYKSKLKDSSYDTEMTFILERVYSISTYYSVFVNIMGKLHSKSKSKLILYNLSYEMYDTGVVSGIKLNKNLNLRSQWSPTGTFHISITELR